MKNLLWYLIAGTKGGPTRGRIIHFIEKNPSNAHKIAKALTLDYKTIRHHLDVLEKNTIIYSINKEKYGAVYFLTEFMEQHMTLFHEIWARFGKN